MVMEITLKLIGRSKFTNLATLVIVNNKLPTTYFTPENTLVRLNTTVMNLELSEEWHFLSKDERFM